jgi:uncharacterized protein involved in exopolysaccharide biosynthesis
MDLYDVLKLLWRRKGTLALVFVLACSSAYGTSKLLPKAYEGRTTLIFPQPEMDSGGVLSQVLSSSAFGRLSGLSGLGGVLGGSQASVDLIQAMLKSRTLAERVASACDLQRVYKTRSMEQTVKTLQRATTVRSEKEQALTLAVRAPSPQLAANVANQTVTELRQMVEEKVDLFLARRQRLFVERQLTRVRGDLRRAEERLARFQETKGIVSLPEETKAAIQTLAELEKEQTLARMAALDADARVAAVRRQVEAQSIRPVEELPAHSPLIRELRGQLVDLNAQLAVARVEFTEEHPQVAQLRAQVGEVERQIAAEVRRVRHAIDAGTAPELTDVEVERIARGASLSALEQAIRSYRRRFDRLPQEGLALARLTRDRTVAEGLYTLLTGEYERARLMEAREGPGFVVLDRAVVPERHVYPRTLINVLLAGVLGLWLGITLAFLLERAAAESRLPAPGSRLPAEANGNLPAEPIGEILAGSREPQSPESRERSEP